MDDKRKELLKKMMAAPSSDSKIDASYIASPFKLNRKGVVLVIGVVILSGLSFEIISGGSNAPTKNTSNVSSSEAAINSKESVVGVADHAISPNKVVEVSALNATGYVVARRKATVSAEQTGKILSIVVEEGQRVKNGDVLATLDDREAQANFRLQESILRSIEAEIKELESKISSAYRNLNRTDTLSQKKLISSVDEESSKTYFEQLNFQLEAKKALKDQALASKELSKKKLDDTQIRAPFDGVITMKNAQPGEIISPVSTGGGFTRTGICTIVDMSSLEIEVDVNENYISKVYKSQDVDITLNAFLDKKYSGNVIAIIPQGSRQSSTIKVRIQFQLIDSRVFPDMGVSITFHEKKSS